MSFALLKFEVADRVATITVNRPDKLNALSDATIKELENAIDEVRGNDDIAGAVLTGAGKAFIAGADIAELRDQTPEQAAARATYGQGVFRKFDQSPKPIIAAVNGFALGGGCELAMACHVRIASESARFGLPEVKLGIAPGYGGTQRLPRLVGRGRALQLILTGEMIDAQEAYRIGLVNKVVPPADVVSSADAMLRQMLGNAPRALALCIDAIDRGGDMSLDEGMKLESQIFSKLAGTSELIERMTAFLEKRPAVVTGK